MRLPRDVQVFLFRALLGASIGYLVVAVFLLRPTGWFGFAHGIWAVICVVGSYRALKAAQAKAPDKF